MNTCAAFADLLDDPDPEAAADAARRRELRDLHLEQLGQLAQAGMDMVQALRAQVCEDGPKVVEGDVALAYGRLSRAVRMAILLQSKLLEEPSPNARADESGAHGRDDDDDAADEIWGRPLPEPTARRMGKFSRLMRHMIECSVEVPERREQMLAEAAERLEADDVRRAIAGRPYGEVIAMICRDLGLQPRWDDVQHKAQRLGWATYEDIRTARDISRASAAPPAATVPPSDPAHARAPPPLAGELSRSD